MKKEQATYNKICAIGSGMFHINNDSYDELLRLYRQALSLTSARLQTFQTDDNLPRTLFYEGIDSLRKELTARAIIELNDSFRESSRESEIAARKSERLTKLAIILSIISLLASGLLAVMSDQTNNSWRETQTRLLTDIRDQSGK